MSDIFLSYSRDDLPRAQQLADALAAEGWSVWFDPQIRSGDMFERVIEKAIAEARCVIVLWSKTSVESDWVRSEAGDGLDREILVPVVIEEGVRIPLRYRQVQTVNLSWWDGSHDDPGFARLVDDLRHFLGAPASVRAAEPAIAAPVSPPAPTAPVAEPIREPLEMDHATPEGGDVLNENPWWQTFATRNSVLVIALLSGLSVIGSVLLGFPLDWRFTRPNSSEAAESAVVVLDDQARVARAQYMIGKKVAYAPGEGGVDPRSPLGRTSDDIGFLAWVIGLSRRFPPGPRALEYNSFLAPDIFDSVAPGAEMVGDLFIAPSQIGIVTALDERGPSRVLMCSKENYEKHGDCVREVDSSLLQGGALIMRVDYDKALLMSVRSP